MSVDIWPNGLADCGEEAVTRLSVRDAWPRTSRRASYQGLSPLISGLVYLNRSLSSSQTENPLKDEEAHESEARKSLRMHVQLARDNDGLSLSFSFFLFHLK